MPTALDDDVVRDGEALSSRPFRNAGRTGRQLSLCGTPEKASYRQMSLSERSSIRVEEIIPAARVAIQVPEQFFSRHLSQAQLRGHLMFSSDHGSG